ncbi:MAG TPA: glycosyltransferase family 4 protein [Candidatus Sumerlaeota bacterium]|nr:glycosyltransferase family 4 protein [Candidatus Sumerlaeota bacterium]
MMPQPELSARAAAASIRVAHLLDGRHFGGAEQMVRRLALASPRVGVAASVYCLSQGRLSEALRADGIPHQVFRSAGRFDLTPLVAMTRTARRDRIQILQAHTSRTHLMARLLSRRLGIPNVTQIQSPIALDENQAHGRHPLRAWVERLGRPWTDAIVTVCEEEARRLVREEGAPPARVRSIPNGLDAPDEPDRTAARARMIQALRERHGVEVGPGEFVVAMIAQMRPRKGPEVLLRAFAQWRRRGEPGRLLIIGDDEFVERGGYLARLKALAAELGLGDHTVFTGFVAEPWELAAGASLFALPSLFGEGLPLVLVEALSRGLPLAVSDIPGNRETVRPGETGWLHAPGEHDQLAEALQAASRNPEQAERMGRGGRRLFLERYTMDAVLRRFRALYEDLLARDRGRHPGS